MNECDKILLVNKVHPMCFESESGQEIYVQIQLLYQDCKCGVLLEELTSGKWYQHLHEITL